MYIVDLGYISIVNVIDFHVSMLPVIKNIVVALSCSDIFSSLYFYAVVLVQ